MGATAQGHTRLAHDVEASCRHQSPVNVLDVEYQFPKVSIEVYLFVRMSGSNRQLRGGSSEPKLFPLGIHSQMS